MSIERIFNLTSKQTISLLSFNGEPIIVVDLGYSKTFEFTDCVITEVGNIITFTDRKGTVLIQKDSIIHRANMLKVEQAQLMQQSLMGMV